MHRSSRPSLAALFELFATGATFVLPGGTPSRWQRAHGLLPAVLLAVLAVGGPCPPAEAARPRRPSAAQMKKMREQMEYVQQEMMRYRNEMAAKEKEIYLSYDENGNGKLEGAEKAKYNKYANEVKNGKVPNPFSAIQPPGQGPKPKGK